MAVVHCQSNIALNLSMTQVGNLSFMISLGGSIPGFAAVNNSAYFAVANLTQFYLDSPSPVVAATGIGASGGGSCAVITDSGDIYVLGTNDRYYFKFNNKLVASKI